MCLVRLGLNSSVPKLKCKLGQNSTVMLLIWVRLVESPSLPELSQKWLKARVRVKSGVVSRVWYHVMSLTRVNNVACHEPSWSGASVRDESDHVILKQSLTQVESNSSCNSSQLSNRGQVTQTKNELDLSLSHTDVVDSDWVVLVTEALPVFITLGW